MQLRKLVSLPAAACAALVLTVAGFAQADSTYSVAVAAGTITVTSQGTWHINSSYPWKLIAGSTTIPASSFSFSDTTATLPGAPKGTATLKGGICANDGGSCSSFTTTVTIQ